jgi:RHS repeat-associated protein
MTARGATTYTYNGDGVLVDDGTTRYTQDLAAPLSQVLQTTQGSATTNYLYGIGRLASVAGSTRMWYGTDALGSVRLTLSDIGTPLSAVDYDPWGTPESGSVPTFGFTGELHDSATGLVNLRARWYSTARGRFTSADSWMGDQAHSQSLNAYGYVGNNPVGLTDPSGHCYPPIEFLRSLEPLNCSNLDQAARIFNHPNASDADKVKAGAYVGAWAFGHAGVLVGALGTGYAVLDAGIAWLAQSASAYLVAHAGVATAVNTASTVVTGGGLGYTAYQAYQGDPHAQTFLPNPGVYGAATLWNDVAEAGDTTK